MATDGSAGPIVLFDGVCNLCSAAVQWVIARDPHAVFRFASLQSAAGRAAIEARLGADAAARLPDSIVLLDEHGLHTRSDAALRIAKHLGFPWSLAAIWLVVPRFLRDAVYDLIARRRYRWFGRQSACMVPTPALRARFLDAYEPRTVASTDANPAAGERGKHRSRLLAWLHRFAIVYLVLSIVPFPLDLIPGGSVVTSAIDAGRRAAVVAFADAVLGVEITVFPGGSGDTTYNYVEVLLHALVALLAATAWTWRGRAAPLGARTRDVVETYLRVFLAVTMLSYGWHKAFPVQMPEPGPGRLMTPIGETSPMGLLWTFMGVSAGYQVFAGIGEVVGGLLLLWRRTALLGALLSAFVMAHVVALNFFFDVPVKLFSSHLLLISLFLVAPHTMRLVALFLFNVPAAPAVLHPFPIRNRWGAPTIVLAKLALVFLVVVLPPIQNWRMLCEFGRLRTVSPLQGVYRVESFVRDDVADRANADDVRWVRFGLSDGGPSTVQFADGHVQRLWLRIDTGKGVLEVRGGGDPQPPTLPFREPEPGVLEIDGSFGGAKVTVRMRREKAPPDTLTTRGFHWINEFPLNR